MAPRPWLMTLVSLPITVAFVFSVAVTFGFPVMDLSWELATLVTIMVLGHWVDVVFFDKTGTLTRGGLHVVEIVTITGR